MSNYSTGDSIRILRTKKRYSQKGLAAAAGLKQVNISYIENNKNKKGINPHFLEKITDAIDTTPAEIENYDAVVKTMGHAYYDNTNREIYFQELSVSNRDKIISLQHETIQTLETLNTAYKKQLEKSL